MPSTRLGKDIRANVKLGTRVSATVVDSFGGKASAKMLVNGALMRNLSVTGGPVRVGDVVYIDFTTSIPTIVAAGRGVTAASGGALSTGTGSGGGGGVTPLEGPGIDLVGAKIGLGGDTVLLYDDTGVPVAEFATITLALAGASSGNMVYVPPGTFVENISIPNGVGLVSMGNNSTITGSVIMVGSSHMKGMLVVLTGSSAGTLVGVTGPATGLGKINDCGIIVTNTGAGDARGIQGGIGAMEIRDSSIDANADSGDAIGLISGTADVYSLHNDLNCISVSGHGHCFVPGGDGDIYAIGGYAWASTSPIGAIP